MGEIWTICEHREGKLKEASLQIAGKAKELAAATSSEAVSLVLGKEAGAIAEQAAAAGAKVLLLEHDLLENYTPEGYAKVLADLAGERNPSTILLAHTSAMGKDLAPRLAARLDAGQAADVVDIALDGSELIFTKPVYAGKAYVKMKIKSEIKIATVRPNSFPKPSAGEAGAVEKISVSLSDADIRAKFKAFKKTESARPELVEADKIVSGGRGIQGPENYVLIEQLADAMGAAAGASRAVVDAGWRPHSDQVGQTGKTVSPNLYVACGISGAIQHLAGMGTSKVIVAINKDPEAPIFKVATYGVVGDLFKVVPALTEEVKKLVQA